MGVDWGQLGSIGVEGVQWGLLITILNFKIFFHLFLSSDCLMEIIYNSYIQQILNNVFNKNRSRNSRCQSKGICLLVLANITKLLSCSIKSVVVSNCKSSERSSRSRSSISSSIYGCSSSGSNSSDISISCISSNSKRTSRSSSFSWSNSNYSNQSLCRRGR